jgi:carboxypeptidase C (cathepsin A)
MAEETTPKPNDDKADVKDNLVQSKHRVTIHGQEIAYTVTCGTITLKEESEKSGDKAGEFEGERPRATIFFVAYTRDEVADPSTRPITFSFNGGPGSSSVWLHLGAFGPRRVEMGDAGALLPPPWKLVNNEHSLLDASDLVFIDPVGTGFSRAVEGEVAKKFHRFAKDIESVGDFIRLYTTRYKRWGSPKFLAGESYGTTRAAALSNYLQERHGLFMNGLMLISSILEFSTALFAPGNDLPHILFLPTFAATAWYHKKLAPELQASLQKTLAEAEAFASGEYATALMKGSRLAEADRDAIAKKLARLTGLTEAYVRRANLRIEIFRFVKELLREQGKTVGRLDSRFVGVDRDSAGENFEFDPSMSAIAGPYTAALNDYVRRDLGFESDLPYEVLSYKVFNNWQYDDHTNRYVNVAESLRSAIANNPFLRAHVANGYFDLATPYFATEYTFSHIGLPPELERNITMSYYEAGHMMYVHMPSLVALKEKLAEFIGQAVMRGQA